MERRWGKKEGRKGRVEECVLMKKINCNFHLTLMYRVDFPSSCAKFWIQVSLILTRSHLANAVNIDKVIGANRKIEISRFVFTDYGQISADRDYNALNDI